jgi:hypothetical protein
MAAVEAMCSSTSTFGATARYFGASVMNCRTVATGRPVFLRSLVTW